MIQDDHLCLLPSCISSLLSPREREIICMRYGLDGQSPLTQKEVARMLGISRSYVSRIEKKALGKLRGCLD
jgi:RNA polymerase sporulation-specific sigma factor